jgi:hypothetical protein
MFTVSLRIGTIVHHLLLNLGFGHAAITFICVCINISFVMLAYSLRSIGSTYVLLIMLTLSFAGFGLLYYRRPRHTMTIAKRMNGATELKNNFQSCYAYAGNSHCRS